MMRGHKSQRYPERFRASIGDLAHNLAEHMEEHLRAQHEAHLREIRAELQELKRAGLQPPNGFSLVNLDALLLKSGGDPDGDETPYRSDGAENLPPAGPVSSFHDTRTPEDQPTHIRQSVGPTRASTNPSLSSWVPVMREDILRILQEHTALPNSPTICQINNAVVAKQQAWTRAQKSPYVLRLDSPGRLLFEFVTLVALVHDITVVPFVLAFDPEVTGNLQALLYFSLITWTVDIFLNFFTSYLRSDGEVELDLKKITAHYIRTWFWLDTAIVLSDWATNILQWVGRKSDVEGLRTLRLVRVVRVSRFFRMMNLVRLFKMSHAFSKIKNSNLYPLSATSTSVVFQALQILVVIVWINHISSCVWFALGRGVVTGFLNSDTNDTWQYGSVGDSGMDYAQIGMLYQYTTSMHWSLTQMTPGSMSVFPRNSYERAWNIICLIFGLLFGTSLVGQLSSKMVQFNMNRQVEIRRMETLRRFLRENSINPTLSDRIQRQIADRMAVKTRLSEADVEDIKHLSNHLLHQLRQDTYLPYLLQHPVFSAWGFYDTRVAKAWCVSGGITFTCVSPAHELFTANSSDDQAYLSLKGSMFFTFADDNDDRASDGPVQMGSGQVSVNPQANWTRYKLNGGAWIGEAALWMIWKHVGALEAETPCDFMAVSSDTMIAILETHHHVAEFTLAWCRELEQYADTEDMDILRRLEVGEHFSQIVMHLPENFRTRVGEYAVEMLKDQRWTRRAAGALMRPFLDDQKLSEWEGELKAGKCTLLVDGSGACLRTVPVVALKIARQSDRKLLVHLAKFAGDLTIASWEKDCKLPGKKMEIGQSARLAAIHLLGEEDMKELAPKAEIGNAIQAVETKDDSEKWHVKSQYVRTIFFAEFQDSEELLAEWKPNMRELELGGDIGTVDAMCVKDKKKDWHLYGWVNEDDFERLRAGASDEEIKNLDWIPHQEEGMLQLRSDPSGRQASMTRSQLRSNKGPYWGWQAAASTLWHRDVSNSRSLSGAASPESSKALDVLEEGAEEEQKEERKEQQREEDLADPNAEGSATALPREKALRGPVTSLCAALPMVHPDQAIEPFNADLEMPLAMLEL